MTRDASDLLADTVLRLEGLYQDRARLTARVAELEAALVEIETLSTESLIENIANAALTRTAKEPT
ncbi:MAG: hypothetical protein H0X01_02040 [Nitrospira sp.]|nr:hypothetical protein [Nitrospira sp.]